MERPGRNAARGGGVMNGIGGENPGGSRVVRPVTAGRSTSRSVVETVSVGVQEPVYRLTAACPEVLVATSTFVRPGDGSRTA